MSVIASRLLVRYLSEEPPNKISDDRTYTKFRETLGHNICPHFSPFDHISTMLGMATSRSSPRTLVESLVGLLRSERKASETSEQ